MTIYNLFPRLCESYDDFFFYIDQAYNMHFDAVFINPINRTGLSGSLYAVRDYFSFNEKWFSSKDDVKKLTEYIKDKEMIPIVDLVINHAAIDSIVFKEHPEWFKKDKKGNYVHPGAWDGDKYITWGDLYEFDYEGAYKSDLYRFMLDVAFFFIDLGFSGFRLDAAYKIPKEFWSFFISNIKTKYPQTIFLAESLGCKIEDTLALIQSGFDYVFNSAKWWNFVDSWFIEQNNKIYESHGKSIAFPESHDTDRIFNEFDFNIGKIKQRMVFTAFISTGFMIVSGLEFGFRNRLSVVENVKRETLEFDFREYIKRLNDIKKRVDGLKIDGFLETKACCPIDVIYKWHEFKLQAVYFINANDYVIEYNIPYEILEDIKDFVFIDRDDLGISDVSDNITLRENDIKVAIPKGVIK